MIFVNDFSSYLCHMVFVFLLQGELISRVAINAEDPLWASIEQSGSTTVDLRSDREESYWANIENTAGKWECRMDNIRRGCKWEVAWTI